MTRFSLLLCKENPLKNWSRLFLKYMQHATEQQKARKKTRLTYAYVVKMRVILLYNCLTDIELFCCRLHILPMFLPLKARVMCSFLCHYKRQNLVYCYNKCILLKTSRM